MNRYSKIIRLLIVLSILSVGAMVLALGAGSREAAFVPPPFEPEAVAGTPEVPEGLGYRELDARVFRVGVCGEVVAQGDRAVLWFTNPMGNKSGCDCGSWMNPAVSWVRRDCFARENMCGLCI